MKLTSLTKRVTLFSAIALTTAFLGLQGFANAKDADSTAFRNSLSTILSSGEPAVVNQAVDDLAMSWQPQNITQILLLLSDACRKCLGFRLINS